MSTSFKEPLDFLSACSSKLRELLNVLAVPLEEKTPISLKYQSQKQKHFLAKLFNYDFVSTVLSHL
jgi:hypothetical protein